MTLRSAVGRWRVIVKFLSRQFRGHRGRPDIFFEFGWSFNLDPDVRPGASSSLEVDWVTNDTPKGKTHMKERFNKLIGFFRALAKAEPRPPKPLVEDSDEFKAEKERHRGMPGPT